MALARGNDFHVSGDGSVLGPYMAVGNKGFEFRRATGSATNRALPQNTICAFNTRLDADNGLVIQHDDESNTGTDGHAYVGNIVEVAGSGSQPCVQIAADSQVENTDNVIFWHNVVVGARVNYGYNDAASARGTRNNWSQVGNLYGNANIKSDGFSQDANDILNWPWLYQTKCRDGGYDFEVNLGFHPEFNGIKIEDNPTLVFKNPQSFYDGGGGNGDYELESGYGFQAINSADQVLPSWANYGAVQTNESHNAFSNKTFDNKTFSGLRF